MVQSGNCWLRGCCDEYCFPLYRKRNAIHPTEPHIFWRLTSILTFKRTKLHKDKIGMKFLAEHGWTLFILTQFSLLHSICRAKFNC
jgi:hypothetical protein